ncbi:MAG: hypothetical protein OXK76_09010 [Gammaproteobacteria bacterium]|nr:hypothetical protein [Gammaproteobacteria bacterium]
MKEVCALVGLSRSTLYACVEEFADTGGQAGRNASPAVGG